jgi:hypothetical protein
MKSAPARVALLLVITSPRQPTGSEMVCLTPLKFNSRDIRVALAPDWRERGVFVFTLL